MRSMAVVKPVAPPPKPLTFKEMGELVKELILTMSDIPGAERQQVTDNFLKVFSQERHHKRLETLVKHYQCMFRGNAVREPGLLAVRADLWERELFAKVEDEKERQLLRKDSQFFIERTTDHAAIRAKIAGIEKVREQRRLEKIAALQRDKVIDIQSNVIDELKSSLQTRSKQKAAEEGEGNPAAPPVLDSTPLDDLFDALDEPVAEMRGGSDDGVVPICSSSESL